PTFVGDVLPVPGAQRCTGEAARRQAIARTTPTDTYVRCRYPRLNMSIWLERRYLAGCDTGGARRPRLRAAEGEEADDVRPPQHGNLRCPLPRAPTRRERRPVAR